jgi:hypothetical protein
MIRSMFRSFHFPFALPALACALYAQTAPQFTISTIGGKGVTGFSGDGGQALNASVNSPVGLFIDAVGNVYFADQNNNRIRKIAPNGIISTVAGTGAAGFGGDNGTITCRLGRTFRRGSGRAGMRTP